MTRRRRKFNVSKATAYDPLTRCYRGTCECQYVAVRAKREAAEHVLAQHVTYMHDGLEVVTR